MFGASYSWWWDKKCGRHENIFISWADKVSINSSAIKEPEIITKGAMKFGNQCIVVAIDAKKK